MSLLQWVEQRSSTTSTRSENQRIKVYIKQSDQEFHAATLTH